MSHNKNNSLISVIIPAYNHERYVQETIQSIIDQTYQNIELIIIDDGSADSTFAKINEMKSLCENRFVRFITQTQQNQGTCTTLNSLLRFAQGEYIYLIASDDRATPDAIEVLHEFLSKNEDYALAVGESLFMDESSTRCYWNKWTNTTYNEDEAYYKSFTDYLIAAKKDIVDFDSDELGSYSTIIKGNYIPNGYLIRKSIFKKTGYFVKEAPLEDYYLMMQISKYAKMKFIKKPLFYYRWHSTNTSTNMAELQEFTDKTILYEVQSVLANGSPIHKKIVQEHLDYAKSEYEKKQNIPELVAKISILLPVYNGEKYLEETLLSVLNQTFKDFELICIDDSSTDSSFKILNHFASKDKRIKVFQKPNGGTAVKSLIFGLPHAKGDYMFYMSQDDLMSNDLLEKMYTKAISSNADAIIPDMAWYNGPQENYTGLSGVRGNKNVTITAKEAFIYSLDWTIHGFSLRKMELVKELAYDDIAMNSDEYMTRKFYLNSNRVVFSDGVFFYRQNNADAITKKLTIGTFEYIITHNRIIPLIIEAKCEREILKIFIISSLGYIKNMKNVLSNNKFSLSNEVYEKARNIIREGYRNLVRMILDNKFYNLLSYKNIRKTNKVKGGLISVIIPAYNHEKYVQETIQSIINQTYENIELLIIDDGSSDSTLNKINEMKEICKKRFVRFKVQTQINQGSCATLNSLLDMAQGEYVYLIASDDRAPSDALAILSDFLSKNEDFALAVGENLFIDDDSKYCYWDVKRDKVYNLRDAVYTSFTEYLMKMKLGIVDFLSDEFGSYSSLLIGNYIPNGYLIRKSIFEKTGYFTKEAPLEDYYLMMQIAKHAKMKYIPKHLFDYRWHDANTVKQKNKMIAMTNDTVLYEIQMVVQSGNIEHLKKIQAYLDSILPPKETAQV